MHRFFSFPMVPTKTLNFVQIYHTYISLMMMMMMTMMEVNMYVD